MKHLFLIFLYLFFASCVPAFQNKEIKGSITGTAGVEGPWYFTKQKCIFAEEAMQIADILIPIALKEVAADGYVKDYEQLENLLTNRLRVCFIAQPEECSNGRESVGPCNEKTGKCNKKRGCALYYVAWSSLCWPPKCEADWLDEPNCTTGVQSVSGWEDIMAHEIYNLVVQNIFQQCMSYTHPIYTVTQPKVKAAYKKASSVSNINITDNICL